MDAKVLLKSQLELRVPVEHDHWVPSLNYRVHLDKENADVATKFKLTNLEISILDYLRRKRRILTKFRLTILKVTTTG